MSADLENRIEAAWEDRANVTPQSSDVREAVGAALTLLDSGEGRVAEPDGKGGWTVNQWLKKAVLLSFRLNDNRVMEGGSAGHPAFDKVPSKFAGWDDARFRQAGFRVVPGAIAREGAYIAPGCVLMPSFVNIGAYVGKGTMVDTGPASAAARRSAKIATYRPVRVLAACWSRCRQIPPLSATIASSAHGARSSKA